MCGVHAAGPIVERQKRRRLLQASVERERVLKGRTRLVRAATLCQDDAEVGMGSRWRDYSRERCQALVVAILVRKHDGQVIPGARVVGLQFQALPQSLLGGGQVSLLVAEVAKVVEQLGVAGVFFQRLGEHLLCLDGITQLRVEPRHMNGSARPLRLKLPRAEILFEGFSGSPMAFQLLGRTATDVGRLLWRQITSGSFGRRGRCRSRRSRERPVAGC